MGADFVIKNGELIRKEDANINIYNKAMFFDFAVYSNIKVVKGRMFIPEIEIDKLFQSADVIGIEHDFNRDEISAWVRKLIDKNSIGDALVRLLLLGADQDNPPLLFIFPVGLTFYPKKMYNQGVKVITFHGERFMPKSKAKSLLLNYIAYREAVKNDALDALLIDHKGNIAEGTRTSFFGVKDNVLLTPPDDDVLEGVTRKIILEIASGIMKIEKRKISLKKIDDFDIIFISSTSMGIMPVNKIDDKKLVPKFGKIKELEKKFKDYCKNN